MVGCSPVALINLGGSLFEFEVKVYQAVVYRLITDSVLSVGALMVGS